MTVRHFTLPSFDPDAISRTHTSEQIDTGEKKVESQTTANASVPETVSPIGTSPIDQSSQTDNVASCEDKRELETAGVGKPQAKKAKAVATPSPKLQAAIDRCVAVRNMPGSFIGWGERSEATAAASLDLVEDMTKDHDSLKHVRKVVNEERHKRGERALNSSTDKELLAVFMCATAKTKADRQECSRFANVIRVAVAEKQTSKNIGAWLKATTLTEALEKARHLNGKPSNKSYSIAITRNKYPHLWENFGPEVRAAIAKALKSVDSNQKKASSHGR